MFSNMLRIRPNSVSFGCADSSLRASAATAARCTSPGVAGDSVTASAAPKADHDDAWPLPLPKGPTEDDLFKALPEKPKRPNPFGDD